MEDSYKERQRLLFEFDLFIRVSHVFRQAGQHGGNLRESSIGPLEMVGSCIGHDTRKVDPGK